MILHLGRFLFIIFLYKINLLLKETTAVRCLLIAISLQSKNISVSYTIAKSRYFKIPKI